MSSTSSSFIIIYTFMFMSFFSDKEWEEVLKSFVIMEHQENVLLAATEIPCCATIGDAPCAPYWNHLSRPVVQIRMEREFFPVPWVELGSLSKCSFGPGIYTSSAANKFVYFSLFALILDIFFHQGIQLLHQWPGRSDCDEGSVGKGLPCQ